MTNYELGAVPVEYTLAPGLPPSTKRFDYRITAFTQHVPSPGPGEVAVYVNGLGPYPANEYNNDGVNLHILDHALYPNDHVTVYVA